MRRPNSSSVVSFRWCWRTTCREWGRQISMCSTRVCRTETPSSPSSCTSAPGRKHTEHLHPPRPPPPLLLTETSPVWRNQPEDHIVAINIKNPDLFWTTALPQRVSLIKHRSHWLMCLSCGPVVMQVTESGSDFWQKQSRHFTSSCLALLVLLLSLLSFPF